MWTKLQVYLVSTMSTVQTKGLLKQSRQHNKQGIWHQYFVLHKKLSWPPLAMQHFRYLKGIKNTYSRNGVLKKSHSRILQKYRKRYTDTWRSNICCFSLMLNRGKKWLRYCIYWQFSDLRNSCKSRKGLETLKWMNIFGQGLLVTVSRGKFIKLADTVSCINFLRNISG